MPAIKFRGVDFIQFDSLLTEEERLVRDTTRNLSKITSSRSSKSATAPAASRVNWSSPWPISAFSELRSKATAAQAWATLSMD